MSNRFFVMGADGKFRKYDDQCDITIHFESEKKRDNFIQFLKDLKDFDIKLPGQQEDKHEG